MSLVGLVLQARQGQRAPEEFPELGHLDSPDQMGWLEFLELLDFPDFLDQQASLVLQVHRDCLA